MTREKMDLLRKGEMIQCEYCGKGYFRPENGIAPEIAEEFICDYCNGRFSFPIDMNALGKGEPIICSKCRIGTWKPMYGIAPDKAPYFKCDHCGNKMHIYYKYKIQKNTEE